MHISYTSVIDLTHRITEEIPVWEADPPVRLQTEARVQTNGFYLQSLQIGEHSGTHFGAQAHFVDGGRTADQFHGNELVRPGICVDLRLLAASQDDFVLEERHVTAFENEHGRIPEGGVVLICTGRGSLWNQPGAYFGPDQNGVMHFPGIGIECAQWLAVERGVVGLGTDTPDIGPGNDKNLVTNRYWLSAPERFHIENLANLHLLPAVGFTLVIAPLSIAGSSGAPARILALV